MISNRPAHAHDPTPDGGDPSGAMREPGIVSVNDHGPVNSDTGKKLAFVGMVMVILAVGAVYGYNQWRAHQKNLQSRAAASQKAENKPAQVSSRRDFAADDKTAKATGITTTTAPLAQGAGQGGIIQAQAQPCRDITITDTAGRPIVGKDGQAIKVSCDGKVVPAIDPRAAPGGAIPTPHGSPSNGQPPPPKPPSRYRGDILLQGSAGGVITAGYNAFTGNPAGVGNIPPSAMPGLAMLQQMMGAAQPRPGPSSISLSAPGALPAAATPNNVATAMPMATGASNTQNTPTTSNNAQGSIGALLSGSTTPRVQASRLADRNFLLPKGAQADCALTTRLVNEVSGFASCVLTENLYSDNGKVLLLERGSEAQGEYVAQLQTGQRRMFVLWQRIKTPNGVVIDLNSPAADGLGTMGVDGHIDNRWWERLGAAFLLSFVKDAIAFGIARSSNGAATPAAGLVFQQSTRTGEQMADRVLSNTINIKPTIYKNQGDRISIYVARDLDFSSVYALRSH